MHVQKPHTNELYFEWDEHKRQTNIKKHGIDFADVTDLFYDEERYIALGMDARSQVVVVVHVYRDIDVIRIISARKADPKECRQYVGGL